MEAVDIELDRQVQKTLNLDKGKDELGTRGQSDLGQSDVGTELGTQDNSQSETEEGGGVSESEEGLNDTPYQSFESSEWQEDEQESEDSLTVVDDSDLLDREEIGEDSLGEGDVDPDLPKGK